MSNVVVYNRAQADAHQDACENLPLTTGGGLDKRNAVVTPQYIADRDADEYLRGLTIEGKEGT